MSEAATRFLYHRPLPFCISEAGDPTGTYPEMDYVVFNDMGDSGLAEAMAFFWNCESVEFTPVGAVSAPTADSFEHIYTSPLPDQTGLTGYEAIWGGIQNDDPDEPAIQPNARVCSGDNSLAEKTVAFYMLTTYARTFPLGEGAQVFLFIRYVSGEWRLYYQFWFGAGPSRAIILCNPTYGAVNLSPSEYTPDITGTVTVFGKTLDWESYIRNEYTLDGVPDLSATSISFTYPAP